MTNQSMPGYDRWKQRNPHGSLNDYEAQREKALKKANPHTTTGMHTFDGSVVINPSTQTRKDEGDLRQHEALAQ